MKKILIIFSILLSTSIANCQDRNNVYLTFQEYKSNSPSYYCDYQLKLRTTWNLFMTGGITNHRIKKKSPSTEFDKIKKEVWGVLVGDSVYINSYPYSKLLGYNKILEKGYYSYFIGEPARLQEEQVKVGIIKEGEKQKGVCCKTGYVILPEGSVKWLCPELLIELVSDQKELVSIADSMDFKPEDTLEMFEILRTYNLNKIKKL